MNDLSVYKELHHYDNKRSLVLNQMTGDVCVMKKLSHYDDEVYAYLSANRNKHIPVIYDYRKDDNNNLIVFEELVQGNTFDIIIADQTMTEKDKLELFLSLLDGLRFLHSAPKPIIHRDLKPSNIIVTENGEVKILDYDAAKIYKPDNTGDTTFLGTDGIAAPEQYGFMQSDPRSDIYAVGKMLEKAFPNNKRILDIAAKASSFDPANRYSSVKELYDVLAKRLGTKKLKPLFPPPGFRTRKWWKMLLAVLFYILAFYLLYDFHGSDNPVENITLVVFLIAVILVSLDICNSWTGLFDFLPFVNHKNIFLRYLFKFIFTVLAALVLILITACFLAIINR